MEILERRTESTPYDQLWMEKYAKLEAFRQAFGHCNVTKTFEAKKLYSWVKNQRSFQRAGKLRKDRVQLLNDLGFIWRQETTATPSLPWIDRYNKLVEFKQKHGHFSIPLAEDSTMNHWVNQQRAQFRLGKLRKDRVELLDKIGFAWMVLAKQNNGAPPAGSSGSVSSKKSTASTDHTVTGELAAGTTAGGTLSKAVKPPKVRVNEPPKIDQTFAFGTRIEKIFDVDGVSDIFGGIVTAFELFQEKDGRKSWGYLIHYDDGDEEHMLEADVTKYLVVVKSVKRAAKSQTKPKSYKRMKQVDVSVTNTNTSVAVEKTTTDYIASQANTKISEKPECTVQTTNTEKDSRSSFTVQGRAKSRKDSTTEKSSSSRAEGNSRVSHMLDAKLSQPLKETTQRSTEAASRATSKVVAKDKDARNHEQPRNNRETESLSSADEPLHSLVRKSELSAQTGAKNKQEERPVQQEVIELLDDDDEEPAATDSIPEQPILHPLSKANASIPHQRFPKGTPISRTFFDLSDNDREKSYGGQVLGYVYVKEDQDWFYFVRYDDGDTEFMDEWEVAKFSSSSITS